MTSEANRARAEYYRALCIDNTGESPVVHAVPRYFTGRAWAYAQQIDACPPRGRECADAGWHCSAELPGGIVRCPDGLDGLVYCPEGRACVESQSLVLGDDPVAAMCASGK